MASGERPFHRVRVDLMHVHLARVAALQLPSLLPPPAPPSPLPPSLPASAPAPSSSASSPSTAFEPSVSIPAASNTVQTQSSSSSPSHPYLYPYRGCVAVGKHVCGAATDFSLRALRDLPIASHNIRNSQDSIDEDADASADLADSPQAKRAKLALCLQSSSDISVGTPSLASMEGVIIATCCHHRCEWKHYVSTLSFRFIHVHVCLACCDDCHQKNQTSHSCLRWAWAARSSRG